jgi:hypothetical protein
LLVVGIAKRRPDGSYLAEPIIAPFQLTWAFPEFHELFPTIAHSDTCDLGYLAHAGPKLLARATGSRAEPPSRVKEWLSDFR